MVSNGAVYVGNQRITDPNYKIREEDFDENNRLLFRVGSKKRGILTKRSE